MWNEIPPRILDEIVYFHPNEMNEIAREKSSRSDDLPYRVTYPHVSNKGKSISFIKEKRFYSCAKNATFSIYIFVLNDRFIQCPFAIYFISYTGHFSVFHERKHLFAFQTSSSQSIKRPCTTLSSFACAPKGGNEPRQFDLIVLETKPSANKPRPIEFCRLIGSTWPDLRRIILLDLPRFAFFFFFLFIRPFKITLSFSLNP